jgi:exopolysaccharide production protein ExoQ
MSKNSHTNALSPLKQDKLPWLLFLFLTAVFFFSYHDPSMAKRAVDDYNPSPDEIVADVSQGQLPRRIALLSLLAVATVSLVRHRTSRRLRIDGPLGCAALSFFACAILSPLWADDLSQNLTRLAVFAILCVTAIALARRLSLPEIILWTFFSTVVYLLIDIGAELFLGNFQPFVPGYRFGGTLHPNGQGIDCALLLLSAIAAADLLKPWRRFFWASGFIGFIFLILSGSRTALAAIGFAIIVYLAAVRSRRTKLAMVSWASMIICLIGLLAVLGWIPGLKSAVLLGRDDPGSIDTFTGRTDIWKDVGPYIERSPIVGYGFDAFWTPARINVISDELEWGVGSSHSTYIDYLLTLGAVGLIAYVLALAFGIGRAFRWFRVSQCSAYAFCGAVLVFCAIDGLFESGIGGASLLMFVWMIVLVRLAFIPFELNFRISSEDRAGLNNARKPNIVVGTSGSAVFN